MDKNYASRKNTEFFMNFFLKQNKYLIEDVIGEEIEEVLLEKNFYGQKIDMYSRLSKSNREIFLETTTGNSSQRHVNFFKELLESIDTPSDIVYIAQTFLENHLKSIISCIKNSKKPIRFYAIEASEALVSEIAELCDCHSMLVYEKLAQITVENPLNLVENIDFDTENNTKETGYEENERTIIEKRNISLIKELRERVPHFLNCWREKKVMSNRILHYSAGRSDATYFLCVGDRHERAFVTLTFGSKTSQIYWMLKANKVQYQHCIDESIEFDDDIQAITVNLPPVHVYQRIDMVVELFAKFVKQFSTEICYWGSDEYEEMKKQIIKV